MSGRVRGGQSFHAEHKPELCVRDERCGVARVVKCDGDRDVVECSKCGKQWSEACTFDEEMS